jgi:UDP-N-acetylglucosamine acyltransferase
MIAANTYVNKDVPPYVKAAHNPITYVGANFLGLRRRGFSNEEIKQIQDIFRVLFQDGHTYTAACELVMAQFPESEIRDQVVEFIRSSKRGILKPYNTAAVAADE